MQAKLGIKTVCLSTVFLLCVRPLQTINPEIQTSLGTIRGFRQNASGKEINTYLGIPFAKPPIGELEFRRPEPIEPWETPFEAVEQPKACPQQLSASAFVNEIHNFTIPADAIDKDCLFLNVWAPQNANKSAVMVWFHPGGFLMTAISLNLYNGKYLSALGDVIVVSIQYRLGLFGFLYLGSEDAPGNQGLVDQHLGIKWVYDHIENFGGDKERITIFGEYAGGSSVHLHTLSNLPKYFSRAILQEASHLNRFSYTSPQEVYTSNVDIVEKLGCPNEGSEKVTECLSKLNHTLLSANAVAYPTLDGYFLTQPPSWNYENASGIELMIGSNLNDGIFYAPSVIQAATDRSLTPPEVSDEEYDATIEVAGVVTEADKRTLEELYADANMDNLNKIDAMLSDAVYACPDLVSADNFTSLAWNVVYLFLLAERSSAALLPDWYGVSYGSEVDLLFGHAFGDFELYTERDKNLSMMMITYWTNFAKTGNPNRDEYNQESHYPDWPRYTVTDRLFMKLQTSPRSQTRPNMSEKCELWERVGVPVSRLTTHSITWTPAVDELGGSPSQGTTVVLHNFFCICLVTVQLLLLYDNL